MMVKPRIDFNSDTRGRPQWRLIFAPGFLDKKLHPQLPIPAQVRKGVVSDRDFRRVATVFWSSSLAALVEFAYQAALRPFEMDDECAAELGMA